MTRWKPIVGAGLLTILVTILLLDRPVARFMVEHFAGTRAVAVVEQVLWPFRLVPILLGGLVIAPWIMQRKGSALPVWGPPLRAAAGRALWALAAAVTLKYLIGRPDPDPVYLIKGSAWPHWLHGSPGFTAFPSATMAATAAFLVGVTRSNSWSIRPAVLAYVALNAAIVFTNGHWLSDTLAGGMLGAAIGLGGSRSFGVQS